MTGPGLFVAALVREGTVLVDPRTGKILRRWPRLSEPLASARDRDGLVLLFPGPVRGGAEGQGTAVPRMAVVDTSRRLRSIALERIQLHARYLDGIGYADGAGLAVDPSRARAYVFAADAPVADVDLRTLHLSYHRLEPLVRPPGGLGNGEIQPADVGARIRRAVWLGNGRALVFGRDLVAADGEDATVAAPATLVHATRWSSCTLDAKAGGAAFAVWRVLVYGADDASSLGLRAYTIDGREAFHLLDAEPVWDVQEAGHLAYVRTRSSVHVVDVRSGTVVSEIAPPAELVDVVVDPP